MKNFIQHKKYIIQNFCDTFKKSAFRNIWGIDLNCNVKSEEEVWVDKELLDYQLLSESVCASGCTVQNPSFLITEYPTCEGTTPFPMVCSFNALKGFTVAPAERYSSGSCCTKVIINNNSTVKVYNFTVGPTSSTTVPANGATTFIYTPLIGFNIQLSLSGYGFFNPGTQYNYDISTGTITLLGGLLFNQNEVYTIFAYT